MFTPRGEARSYKFFTCNTLFSRIFVIANIFSLSLSLSLSRADDDDEIHHLPSRNLPRSISVLSRRDVLTRHSIGHIERRASARANFHPPSERNVSRRVFQSPSAVSVSGGILRALVPGVPSVCTAIRARGAVFQRRAETGTGSDGFFGRLRGGARVVLEVED